MTHHKPRWSNKYRVLMRVIDQLTHVVNTTQHDGVREHYTERIVEWQDKLKKEYVRMTNEQNGFN